MGHEPGEGSHRSHYTQYSVLNDKVCLENKSQLSSYHWLKIDFSISGFFFIIYFSYLL